MPNQAKLKVRAAEVSHYVDPSLRRRNASLIDEEGVVPDSSVVVDVAIASDIMAEPQVCSRQHRQVSEG